MTEARATRSGIERGPLRPPLPDVPFPVQPGEEEEEDEFDIQFKKWEEKWG